MSEPATVAHPRPNPSPEPDLLWSYLRSQLRRHWRFALGGLLLNSVSGFAVAFQTLTPKYLVDDVLTPTGMSPGRRLGWLVALLAAYLLASLVARMLFWHLSYRLFMRVREAVLLELRSNFFRHVNGLCLRFHSRNSSGELFNYLFGTPLSQVQQFLNSLAMSGPSQGFTVLASLAWVAGWDWRMALVLTVSVFASVWVSRSSQRRVKELHQEFQGREGAVSGQVADLLRGAREVKLYAVEGAVTREFDTQAAGLSRQTITRDTLSHIQWMKQESVGYLFFVLLCAVGAWRFLYAGLTAGELLTYLTAFIALQGPLQQLFQLGVFGATARASFARIRAVLDTESTTPDPAMPTELPARGEIVFDDVRFRYDDSKTTLDGVSFRVPYGQRIALVGPSGAGKSTVAQLLLRLYDPDGGAVCIGGVDLRACRGADVRRMFGVVPQSPYFFQATVRENLQLLAKGANDDAALRRACELAHAWEFVSKLPHGLDTAIGESGSTLSGGQKQRLAIARALLADPPFLVFDEATSALDTVSERLIQAALDRNLGHRTAVFIAHRLATIRTCDRILVMDEGRVVQDGTFAGLRATPGLFRDMVEADEFEESNVRPGVAMTTAA